ncbi:MAG TPA: hypothetical protein VN724_04475 [Pyrinomonadaceae bacterium]|nr:hypothetical protein [Pyrinomonadaceae bacterium]
MTRCTSSASSLRFIGPALIDEERCFGIFARDSAKGAKYDSQGQARSASPLDV